MKILSEEQIAEIVARILVLVKKGRKNTKALISEMHDLLEKSPGETLKVRQQFVTDSFKSEGPSYYKYLRKIIRSVALEGELELSPGTLNEYQARELLKVKSRSLRKRAYKLAVELAEPKTPTTNHIKQAIDEITKPDIPTKKEPQSSSENTRKPDKNPKKDTSEETVSADSWLTDGPEDSTAPEVKAQEILKKIEPYLKTSSDKILLIRVLMASKNFWKVCKKLEDLGYTANNTEQLIDLIDPDGDCRKIIAAKGRNKTMPGRKKPFGRPGTKQPFRTGPNKTLHN